MAWIAYLITWLPTSSSPAHHTARWRVEAVVYLITVTLLTGSALAYLICRLGFFYRTPDPPAGRRGHPGRVLRPARPTVTVIIPSYKEDERIIRTTLLSAALQEYPGLRVVLLIDDPTHPKTQKDRELLEAARALPGQIERAAGRACQPVHRRAAGLRSLRRRRTRSTSPT